MYPICHKRWRICALLDRNIARLCCLQPGNNGESQRLGGVLVKNEAFIKDVGNLVDRIRYWLVKNRLLTVWHLIHPEMEVKAKSILPHKK